MATLWDDKSFTDLAGKPYMSPVSPWFSTHFSSKNWVYIWGELITDRWNQMLALQPQLVEIITWNEPNHAVDGSSEWAVGFPHDGADCLQSKRYIAAYKAGASKPTVASGQLVYWWQPTPWDVTYGRNLLADDVFVIAILTSPAQLTIQSRSTAAVTISVPAGIMTNKCTMGLGSQMFTDTRYGASPMVGTGAKQITNSCVSYNYNAYVGSFNATGGPNFPSSIISSNLATSTSSPSKPSTASTTALPPTSTNSTSTSTMASPSSNSVAIVCVGGTASGNYVGLCNFRWQYPYCPSRPCTCKASGAPIRTRPATGVNGYPLVN